MKQLIHLIGQHRFYAAACMVGTAVTLAFVMVVVMVYDFRTADVAPETERSRMLYNTGTQCMRANGTNLMGYRGLGPTAFEALYNNLLGVDTLTWHGGLQRALCSLPASSDRQSVFLRPVAANWFSFFSYDFVAGRPFTQAEYDAGRAAFQEAEDEWRSYRSLEDGVTRRFVVITERLARQLFGSADRAVGGEMQMDFQLVRVVGVVSDVSSIFQTAYADVWEPFTLLNETQNYTVRETGGLAGLRYAVIRKTSGASSSDIRAEVEHRLERLNRSGGEYVLSDPQIYTHTEYTFFRGSSIDARDYPVGGARRGHIGAGTRPDAEPPERDSHPQGLRSDQRRHHRAVVLRELGHDAHRWLVGLRAVVFAGRGGQCLAVRCGRRAGVGHRAGG